MVRRIESSIACRDRWSSKAQDIQRCKSGHASSLAVWIESKSPSVGGRKISRGVTIGIKWRIERLSWNCSGPGEDENAHCLHAVLRARATQRSVFGFAGSKLSVLLVSRFLPASKVCLWCGSQHRPKHFNESTYTVVTQRGLERVVEDGIACAVGKIGEHDGVLDTQVQSLWLAAIQA